MKTDNLNDQRYLQFALGEEQFAIPLLSVKEVISLPEVTPIPKSPNFFKGIINLRGTVISVVDLRTKLTIKPKENNKEEATIILDINNSNLGVVVDSIDKVLNIAIESISKLPEVNSKVGNQFINGVFQKEDELILLIDLQKILNDTPIMKS